MLADLQKTATIRESTLASAIGLKLLGRYEAFQFFSYLFNLEKWAGDDQLRPDSGVDRQIAKGPVSWDKDTGNDDPRVGKRHVQMFSLMTMLEASRLCLFSGLLSLDCDAVLCSTWRPKSALAARKEIDNGKKLTSFFEKTAQAKVAENQRRRLSVIGMLHAGADPVLRSERRTFLSLQTQ